MSIKETGDCSPANKKMKTALFTNFTPVEFIGYWNGKAKKFAPGDSLYMPDYLAKHFAKHLTNQELVRKDANGDSIYKDGEKSTSPKKPEEVPMFQDLFNKAYTPEDTDELGQAEDGIDTLIDAAQKNREAKLLKDQPDSEKKPSEKQDPTQPQVIIPPDFDEEDDGENSFKGKPVE